MAGFGEHDDVAAPIPGVRAARDQVLALQRVEQADHRRAVDAQARGRLLLGLGLAAVEEQEHREFAGADAGRPEVLLVQGLEVDQGALEQVGEPGAEPRPEVVLAGHAAILLLR